MLTVKIGLTKGLYAIVDIVDADLALHNWHANGYNGRYYATSESFYVRGKYNLVTKQMHRRILERMLGRKLSKSEIADHIDGDSLNNRRSNLRLATVAQNVQNSRIRSNNTSGYKGVSFVSKRNRWQAIIRANGKPKHLGYFNTPEEAQNAYYEATKLYFGEFARKG